MYLFSTELESAIGSALARKLHKLPLAVHIVRAAVKKGLDASKYKKEIQSELGHYDRNINGYLTLSEAENHFRISADTLRKACLRGKLVGVKRAKTWFVKSSDVKRWLKM